MGNEESSRHRKIVREFIAFAVEGMWTMWVLGALFGATFFMPDAVGFLPAWGWALVAIITLFISNFIVNMKSVVAINKIAIVEE